MLATTPFVCQTFAAFQLPVSQFHCDSIHHPTHPPFSTRSGELSPSPAATQSLSELQFPTHENANRLTSGHRVSKSANK
ncbi:hypothetical protein BJX66DRAFT_302205 [Aspergillus keveii]|uniref:Uncharacterized protein n=1 Tax=Aspergillus keveii TaxID=714993 RepID=A0ABR4G9E5_9EURO